MGQIVLFEPPEPFIPVGCLVLSEVVRSHHHDHGDTLWHQLAPSDLESAKSTEWVPDLLPLLTNGWIRLFAHATKPIWRVYVLPGKYYAFTHLVLTSLCPEMNLLLFPVICEKLDPSYDTARASIDRSQPSLRKHLGHILATLSVTQATWNGELPDPKNGQTTQQTFDPWATSTPFSLYYLFNTIESPSADPSTIPNRFGRAAAHALLDASTDLYGLRTSLYPYQRRSAAAMLHRETAPSMQLDPRLERRTAPNGSSYYYGPRDQSFFKEPRYYDTCRGGILAETMGLGKTLICIALILATRGHYPSIPPHYEPPPLQERPRVGSLFDMAIATAARKCIPWQPVFEILRRRSGMHHESCTRALELQTNFYEIPPKVIRSNRSSNILGPPTRIIVSSGTCIVVPRNLLAQWQSEFSKHVDGGSLRLLVMDKPKDFLPSSSVLAKYDVVLFSRSRFETEVRQTEELYESPLKSIHWLRLIVDEGHGFSSSNTNAALAAEKLVRAEHRWIVSGTPAKDLLGVEVETGSLTARSSVEQSHIYREQALMNRKSFDYVQESNSGAIKSLGSLTARFLRTAPWAPTGDIALESSAVWEEHVYRHQHLKERTYKNFSQCLVTTLKQIVIRTQPEDVERDLSLPQLTHSIVRLHPSTYDKMTANLFVLLFTVNAVTSERTDQDYLFHRASVGHLQRLISNLRQSTFTWSGFKRDMVEKSIEVANKYLSNPTRACSDKDRLLMEEAINQAKMALTSPAWSAMSQTAEMGVAVEAWPDRLCDAWAFQGCAKPSMIMGLSQCSGAQKFVNDHLSSDDPLEGLEPLGIQLNQQALEEAEETRHKGHLVQSATSGAQVLGSPLDVDIMGSKRLSVSGVSKISPKRKRSETVTNGHPDQAGMSSVDYKDPTEPPKRTAKRRPTAKAPTIDLTPDSPLGSTHMIGSTSAKFSYLISRILELYEREKVLVFYEGNHVAYYISQALDLLNVKHLIYANTLSSDQRSRYIVLFNADQNQRVLLMDIKQAAHGLNLSSASRVFFVNPPYRPDIEAQAIKRAHRIGQTLPVHVETLLLQGTVEEKMYERTAAMSQREHLEARSLEDDAGIRGILQNARVLPISEPGPDGSNDECPIAPLTRPQQLFGRAGRDSKMSGMEKELFGEKNKNGEASPTKPPAKKRARPSKDKPSHTTMTLQPMRPPPPPQERTPDTGGIASIFGG